jgi:hypothetical protein
VVNACSNLELPASSLRGTDALGCAPLSALVVRLSAEASHCMVKVREIDDAALSSVQEELDKQKRHTFSKVPPYSAFAL